MSSGSKIADGIDKWFHITERGSTVSTEIRAGVATFLTMSYILLVNPQILSQAGLPVDQVCTATALTSALASLLVGLFANLPVGLAPGMGLNAFFVFSQVIGLGTTIPAALAQCMFAAVLVGVLAVVHALTLVLALVPNSIKIATIVGMGLLLSLIGMQESGAVVANRETMVALGDIMTVKTGLAMGGLALIASMHYRGVKGSILIGILVVSLAFWYLQNTWPTQLVSLPALHINNMDFSELLAFKPEAYSAVVAYALVMIFDIGGAMYGLGNLAGLVKNNVVPGAIVTYVAAALCSGLGALTGTTPLIIAAESAVGIKEGGRTGLVAVTISACFVLSLFISPILKAVPSAATAPVLVLVGTMMMSESVHIDWHTMPSAVPAFLTIVVQPFSFSIANGIYAGLIFSLLLFVLSGDFIPYFRNLMWPPGQAAQQEALDVVPELQDPLIPGSPTPGGQFERRSHNMASQVTASVAMPLASLVRGVAKNINSYQEHPFERKPSEMLVSSYVDSSSLARSPME